MARSNYYNHIAPIYDQTRWMTDSVAEEVAEVILARVGATSQTSFLEPGVGTGLNVMPLVKRGYSVTGVDISPAMLNQFQQKLPKIPTNLKLIQADASQLPLPTASFDVVLTVHMVHTVSNWKIFLDEIERVLKPQGFYLNAQWITPPARMEFEHHFRAILSRYQEAQDPKRSNRAAEDINVEDYFHSKGYRSDYVIAKTWIVSNTIEELLSFFQSRAYGFCWQLSDEAFHGAMKEFEEFCLDHYGSLATTLSSEAKFELWTYTPEKLNV